ncbi:MAG: methyl-accepting chemotaxis protein [Gemmatimonadota bacterium]|nr:methyl-accepting chemotaxis protein [Gemmatimonadota bacterium]
MAAVAHLRTRTVLFAFPAALVAVATGVISVYVVTSNRLEREAHTRLVAASSRAAEYVDRYLADRQRDLTRLAALPAVGGLAREAAAEAVRGGLDRADRESLEQRFADSRTLRRDRGLEGFFRTFLEGSDFVDIMFTERNGLNVLATSLPTDFVQADEEWWQLAMRDGVFVGAPEFDETARGAALPVAVRIPDPAGGPPLGVLQAVIRLGSLTQTVARLAGGEGMIVEVVDSLHRTVAGALRTQLLRRSTFADDLRRDTGPSVQPTTVGGEPATLASVPVLDGRWQVIVAQPNAIALLTARFVGRTIAIGGALGLVVILVLVLVVSEWMDTRIARPIKTATDAATAVAGGDLTIRPPQAARGIGEVAVLQRATGDMVTELRVLVTNIRGAAEDMAAMAQQISASTEEMSASTQEMATTSQKLTDEATMQAGRVRGSAEDASRILAITTQLADGARLAAERSVELREGADRHRGRLVEGSTQLTELAGEVERTAGEAETLAGLSTEIQQFVTQARTVATRTNMLALNAAIEAARAGAEGRGFAVVADEVRKLAGQAAQAAQTTSDTVARVLQGITTTRERLVRLAQESAAVRDVAVEVAGGLEDITGQAVEGSAWADEISTAAAEARRLVEEISHRLDALAEGTETSVAAIEQIAAAAEEQSASTEEIASSASHLAEASERLNAQVSRFRLSSTERVGD